MNFVYILNTISGNKLNKFQAKTYVEALKSPSSESRTKRSGWKIQVSPQGDAQMTLEAAFDAGRLVREAKMLKRKAHLEQDQITVSVNFRIKSGHERTN